MRTRADEVVDSLPYRRDVTDRNLSGEAGISRRFSAVEPYFHVASGFRGPNLQERYFRNTIHGGMRVYGNPDLVPERSMSYEAGVRIGESWDGRITHLRVSAYRSDVEDLINLKYHGLNRGLSDFEYVNVEQARLEGVELAGQLRFGWLGVGLSFAAPRGHDTDTGEKLVDSGVARATIDLAAPLRLVPNGRIALRARWTDGVTGDGLAGSIETVNSLIRPAFWTGSVEVSSMFAGFLAMVSVNNLPNTYYLEPLSFIPEPGRTVVVSLRRDFNIPLPNSRTSQP
jgi:outer membrane receptor protein involved in Fe transport